MGPHKESIREYPHLLAHLLAGLASGVVGSVAMLLWLMLGSIWLRRSVWTISNLFATTFAGPDAYLNHFAATSPGGAALVVVIYSTLGALWGLGCGVRQVSRQSQQLSLFGAAYGLLVYFSFFHWIWPLVRPLIALYAPANQLIAAHIIWGAMLSRSPRTAQGLTDSGAGDSDAGDAEFRVGEVIR